MDSADSEVPGVSTRYRRYSKEFQKMINTRELDWIDEYNENILFHNNIKNGKVEWGKQLNKKFWGKRICPMIQILKFFESEKHPWLIAQE